MIYVLWALIPPNSTHIAMNALKNVSDVLHHSNAFHVNKATFSFKLVVIALKLALPRTSQIPIEMCARNAYILAMNVYLAMNAYHALMASTTIKHVLLFALLITIQTINQFHVSFAIILV